MTVLHPCLHCHRKADCQIKRDALIRIRGLGLTKATLRCKIPEQDFPAGSRVSVRTFILNYGQYADSGPVAVRTDRIGAVAHWRNRKATVVLDKDQEIESLDDDDVRIGVVKVPSDRLTRLDEVTKEMCDCGLLTLDRCHKADFPMIKGSKEFYCDREQAQREPSYAWLAP